MRAPQTACTLERTRISPGLGLVLAVAAVVFAAAPTTGAAEESIPDHATLRARAARWVETTPLLRVAVVIDVAASTASYTLETVAPLDVAQAFALEPEDPLLPLYRAQVSIEAVRAFVVDPVADEPAGRRDLRQLWAQVLELGERQITTGLDEIRSGVQPTGALQDRATTLGTKVEVALFDALLDWADAHGLALGAGALDPAAKRVELPSAEALQKLAVGEAGYRPLVGPTIREFEGGIEYTLGSVPEALDSAEPAMLRPLVDAGVRLELLRKFAAEADEAGTGPTVDLWQPVLDAGHSLLKLALESLRERTARKHAVSVLTRSSEMWSARIRDLVFNRLWEHANKRDLALWALLAPTAGADGPPKPDPMPGTRELRLAVVPDRWVSSPRPAEYQTVTEKRLVEPARKERRWIAPELAINDNGEPVVVRPGRWEDVEIPAVYETITRQVVIAPAHRDFEFKPARYISIQIAEAFGAVRHVWFLDRWSYDRRTKYRPDPSTAWDQPPGTPQHPPWIDLTTSAEALVRRRQPVIEGYVIVVGTKGASGPSLVRFGETVEGTPVFSACDRTLTPPLPSEAPQPPPK